MSDNDKKSPDSLWQPVASGKVTDVTPEPVTGPSAPPITSRSTTVASSATTAKPAAVSSTVSGGAAPPHDVPPRPSDASPQPPRSPRPRGLSGVAAGIVFVVVVLAVLYALAPHWLPALMTRAGIASNAPAVAPAIGMSDADKQKLDAQLADINARLAALKTPTTDPGLGDQVRKLQAQLQQLASDQNGLNDRIGQLNANQANNVGKPTIDPAFNDRLDALQKQVDTGAAADAANKNLRGDIEALTAELGKAADQAAKLDQRLTALEKSVAGQQNVDQRSVDAARASATMALAARLRSNIDAGRGFADDLAALKPLIGGDAEMAAVLTTLGPLSTGTDGISALRQSFPAVARATVTGGASDSADSWWDKAVARLSSVVSVRRVGEDVTGDTAEAHVARAEAMLNAGRLAAAVAELKPLTGNAAKAAAPWLAKAERQLAAIKAADSLQALASQRLATIQQTR